MADTQSRAGSGYLTPEILAHVAETHAPHDDGLEWAFTAPGREGVPAIQLAHNEGKTLALLIQLSRAKKVVEVGTLVGYSGIWIARALPPGGHLWTLELDPKHAAIARKNFERAGVADRVTVVEGPASESLAGLSSEGPFDAVFIDADKGRYPEYGAWATKHLREGGLIVGDNSFYFGRLLDDSDEAEAMRRFHAEVAAHFDSVCVPTPDGLVVGVRRAGRGPK